MQKHTYTFALLKENIYKNLEEYSLNGEEVSVSTGIAADIEKRFIASLNMCLERVAMSLPLLENSVKLTFSAFEGGCVRAELPDDFYRLIHIRRENGGNVKSGSVVTDDGYIITRSLSDGESAYLTYSVMPQPFTGDTPADRKIDLPDVTCSALVYLTASELCPTDCSELYSRLIYKYQDVALNVYNSVASKKPRNTVFAPSRRRRCVWDT